MTKFNDPTIRGNWATLLLPINEDESINYALLSEMMDHFIAAGVDGVYSNGSAGEFYTQNEDEFDRISQLLSDKCRSAKVPFQIGVCHMSPQISLARINRTKDLGPTAYQVILPDWYRPQFEEIINFLERLAQSAAPIPLVVYNPPHAKRLLSPGEWLAIANKIPGVKGMKVAGGDAVWYEEMRPVLERISVFVPGHYLATGIAHGAHGSYSNIACLNPSAAQKWYELIVRDPVAGKRVEERILSFFDAYVKPLIADQAYSNMAIDKCLAVAGGWTELTTRLRWPYRSVPMADALKMRALIARDLPEFSG